MSGGSGADFMIHGIVKYHLFGHELWLTTTTVGMTIVTIVLLILVIAANRALKHATDVPGTFQNIIEFGMEMLENMTTGILGSSANRFANYIGTIFLFIFVLQSERSVRPENGYCRLWCYVPSWSGHVCDRTVPGNQKSWCRTLYGTVSTSPGAVPDQSDR